MAPNEPYPRQETVVSLLDVVRDKPSFFVWPVLTSDPRHRGLMNWRRPYRDGHEDV